MTYNVVSTGSSGNAVLINGGVLIDCGVPWKRLGPYASALRLVLLTHEHGDHFSPSTARALHKQRPGIRWGCCDWMVPHLLDAGVGWSVIDVYKPGRGDMYVNFLMLTPVEIPHNVQNCAYKITFIDDRHNGESIFYATDCATLDGVSAAGYGLYMIEANHGEEEIKERIQAKRAAGLYAYETEAARNHLSEEQALDWLARNMGPGSEYVFLHQHRERN